MATPAAQMPSVCSSRSKATPVRRDGLEVRPAVRQAASASSACASRSCARSAPRPRSSSSCGEIGLAVGRAIEREGFADRRHRAQPLRADHLIDEHEMVVLDRWRDRRSRAVPPKARTRKGRASATKSVRTEAASRRIVGPSRTRPFGDAAITSFSASSAATMRCTVERARSDALRDLRRGSGPRSLSSSARRIVAARAITCTWFFSGFLSALGVFGACLIATFMLVFQCETDGLHCCRKCLSGHRPEAAVHS